MLSEAFTAANATICVFALTFAIAASNYLRTRGRKYPPGPPGEPLIGHLRTLPLENPYIHYTELKKKYGDIVHVDALNQPVMLLGSFEVNNQLLGKRGTIYSERPNLPIVDTVLDLKERPPLARYGPIWKEERRLYHNHLGKDSIKDLYRPDLEARAHQYVLRGIEDGKIISQEYYNSLLTTFLESMYGYKVKSDDDEFLKTALIGTEIGSNTLTPGKYLVNLFPSLFYLPKWLPGMAWKRDGEEWRRVLHRMIRKPFFHAKDEMEQGIAKQSFVANMLREKTTLTQDQVMYTAGSTFTAGAETTAAVVQYFLAAMTKNPEVQKKAQEEIDSVVGHDRLPGLDDLPNLPYVDAIYKEALRWQPAAPVSVPHVLAKDDVYNGYDIPKGSLLIQNTWALARDETMYPEPEKFMPERFLTKDPPMDPRLYAFGIGRRICPGQHYGEAAVLATMLAILASVDVVHQVDKAGKEIPLEVKSTGRLINSPISFEVKFRPRSEATLTRLREFIEATY